MENIATFCAIDDFCPKFEPGGNGVCWKARSSGVDGAKGCV